MDWTFRRIVSQFRRHALPTGFVFCLSLTPGVTVAADGGQDLAPAIGSAATVEATAEDGRLTLHAHGAPLADVLRAIGNAGSFRVVLRGDLAKPVHRSFGNERLEDAIRKLVGEHSLIVIRDNSTPEEVVTGLVEIRVTANRARVPSEAADGEVAALEPDVELKEEAIDPVVQQEAYRQAVLDYMPPTKDDLMFELGEPDPAARVLAVPKVGSLTTNEAVEILFHVFSSDEDGTVRSRAVAALTRLDGPSARGLLRERALGDDDPGLRMQALNALASSRGERAVNIVAKALRQDPEPEVRMAAISALQRFGGDWGRRYVEHAVADPDAEIGAAAEQALASWPEPHD